MIQKLLRARPARRSPTRPPPVRAGTLRVLSYHRIADPDRTPDLDPSLVSATPEDFRSQMLHLASRYHVVSLQEVRNACLGGRRLPRRAVLVTFDDAYRDFAEEAWPILRELGLPVTVFVPTAYPGRPDRAFWWDRLHRAVKRLQGHGSGEGPRRRLDPDPLELLGPEPCNPARVRARMKALPHEDVVRIIDQLEAAFWDEPSSPSGPPPVLGWDELLTLEAEGVTLGSHTRWHPALIHATEDSIRKELRGSLKDLRGRAPAAPAVLCYPYGLHDDRVIRIAREEGFEIGFTCLPGLNRLGRTDPLRLRRTTVNPRTTPILFRVRMLPWFGVVDRWRHRIKKWRSGAVAISEGVARLRSGNTNSTSAEDTR